jgi:copper homeostasis protein
MIRTPVTLEVCANSVTSAIAAQEGGAIRAELCENLHEGGTTPSYADILLARKLLNIQLYVLIRPRGGDFLYSDLEYQIMTEDVKHCLDAGCDGIVIGILNTDGTVDKARCAKLVEMAHQAGAGVTFHRAFDLSNDQFKAMEDIIDLGCERILTSGGKTTAIEGARRIAELIVRANGRIGIMAGSGVNENNVRDLVHYTGLTEVHSSARVRLQSKMTYQNDHIIMSNTYGDEYSHEVTDVDRVRAILANANKQ